MSRAVALNDIGFELRKAYYTALNGNISASVYDAVTPRGVVDLNDDFQYVLLSTQTSISDNDKSSQGHECTILIDVITGRRQFIGKKENDDLVAEILPIIYPQSTSYLSVTGFKIITTELVGNEDLIEQSDNFVTVRRLIRMRHLIRQT